MQVDIDELEKSLSQLEATAAKPNHEDLYKNWGRLGNQEERRKELLEIQKSNRSNKIDSFRGILELVNAVEENDVFQSKKKVIYRPSIYVAGFHKTSLTYSNVLMLSEWMVEKPENFANDWYLVPCPKGVRTLIVSHGGKTKFYTKYGHFKFEHQTLLPGGSHKSKRGCCVLDGFYIGTAQTVHILDLLAWKDQPMTDGETEFRHFWLEGKFNEIGADLQKISKNNSIKLEILPKIPCTNENLTEHLSRYPMLPTNLDGLLFYHRRAHYVAGETPLVGWLFPYMVPEIIDKDIKIHPFYEEEKPKDYTNQKDFIQNFAYEKERKKKNRHSKSMEVDKLEANDLENNLIKAQEQDKGIPVNMETKTEDSIVTKTEELMETKTEDGIETKTEELMETKTEDGIETKTEELTETKMTN
ncbi:snurportin-1 [Aricia agestis]|uniref:snurportin-1 n=1 Tax=Aricia agestis TaxID=91739 RepID=UPI001C20ADDC|nr:snurportin-1 [Aricia agestis]